MHSPPVPSQVPEVCPPGRQVFMSDRRTRGAAANSCVLGRGGGRAAHTRTGKLSSERATSSVCGEGGSQTEQGTPLSRLHCTAVSGGISWKSAEQREGPPWVWRGGGASRLLLLKVPVVC